jgi:hypothetical protein
VVAANECDSVWVSYFQAQEKEERFKRIESTIDEITCGYQPLRLKIVTNPRSLTHEQVVGIWHVATDTEQLHQIMKLAMDISTYLLQYHQPYSHQYAVGALTVTGASTPTTFPSSMSSSRAL